MTRRALDNQGKQSGISLAPHRPIDYADASPEVRAVFDDIKQARQISLGRSNQFLEILGARPGDAQAHLGEHQGDHGAGHARRFDQGNGLSGGERHQWLRLLQSPAMARRRAKPA